MCFHNGSAGECKGQRGHMAHLQIELWKRNALYVFRTEVQANGRQVTWPPLQSELRKQNAICVFITEVQAQTGHAASSALWKRNALCVFRTELPVNGNSRQVTQPPLQTELQKRNAICMFIMWKWQKGHAVSSAK